MTFEEWWETIYTPPMYSPLDIYEMQKAFEAGYEAGRDDEEVRWNDSLYGV